MKKYIIPFLCIMLFLFAGGVAHATFVQTLKYGMTNNDEVRQLQSYLIANGYLQGTPNGSIFETTKNAIIKFQRANGLDADGIVGRNTRAILNNLANGTSGASTAPVLPTNTVSKCGLNVTYPTMSAIVNFPLTITGYLNPGVQCSWRNFEGSAGAVEVQKVINGNWQSIGVSSFINLQGGPIHPYNSSNPPIFSVTLPSSAVLPVSGEVFRLVFTESGDSASVPESWDVTDQMAIRLVRQ